MSGGLINVNAEILGKVGEELGNLMRDWLPCNYCVVHRCMQGCYTYLRGVVFVLRFLVVCVLVHNSYVTGNLRS